MKAGPRFFVSFAIVLVAGFIIQMKERKEESHIKRNILDTMPAAGHLVHMPSHNYIRTEDYQKGVKANEKASAADSIYIAQCWQ